MIRTGAKRALGRVHDLDAAGGQVGAQGVGGLGDALRPCGLRCAWAMQRLDLRRRRSSRAAQRRTRWAASQASGSAWRVPEARRRRRARSRSRRSSERRFTSFGASTLPSRMRFASVSASLKHENATAELKSSSSASLQALEPARASRSRSATGPSPAGLPTASCSRSRRSSVRLARRPARALGFFEARAAAAAPSRRRRRRRVTS